MQQSSQQQQMSAEYQQQLQLYATNYQAYMEHQQALANRNQAIATAAAMNNQAQFSQTGPLEQLANTAAQQAYAQHVAHQMLMRQADHCTGVEKLLLASMLNDTPGQLHPSCSERQARPHHYLPFGRGIGYYQPSQEAYETAPTPRTRSELELYRLLERANLLQYYSTFLNYGADDINQLVEADEDEFLEIMSLVGMTRKPLHVRRLQRALSVWRRSSQFECATSEQARPPTRLPSRRTSRRLFQENSWRSSTSRSGCSSAAIVRSFSPIRPASSNSAVADNQPGRELPVDG